MLLILTFANGGADSPIDQHILEGLPDGELQAPLALDALLHRLPDQSVQVTDFTAVHATLSFSFSVSISVFWHPILSRECQ